MIKDIILDGTRKEWCYQRENDVTRLIIVTTELEAEWPGGHADVIFQRADGSKYLHAIDMEEGRVSLLLNEGDAWFAGVCMVTLTWILENHRKKTIVFSGLIRSTLTDPDAEPTEPEKGYIEQMMDIAESAIAAAEKATEAVDDIEDARDDAIVRIDSISEQAARDIAQRSEQAVETIQTEANAITEHAAEQIRDAAGDAKDIVLREIAESTKDAETAAENAAESARDAANAAGTATAAKDGAVQAKSGAEAAARQAQEALSGKQDKLTPGKNISIVGNVISAQGGEVTKQAVIDAMGYTPANDADVAEVKDDYLAQQHSIDDHESRIVTLEQSGGGDPQTESELVHAENMNTFWLENFLGHIDYLIDGDGIAQDDEGKRLVEVLNMSNRLEDEILTEIFETGIMED